MWCRVQRIFPFGASAQQEKGKFSWRCTFTGTYDLHLSTGIEIQLVQHKRNAGAMNHCDVSRYFLSTCQVSVDSQISICSMTSDREFEQIPKYGHVSSYMLEVLHWLPICLCMSIGLLPYYGNVTSSPPMPIFVSFVFP